MSPKTEFKYFGRIFFFLGLSSVQPFLRKKSSNHNLFLYIPVLMQAIMIISELIWLHFFTKELFNPKNNQNESPLAVANAIKYRHISIYIQSMGLLFVAVIQIAESICKGDIDRKIKESIALFDQEMFARHSCRDPCSFCKKRSLKKFFGRIIFMFVIWFIMDISVLLTIDKSEKVWRQCVLLREFSSNMIRIGLIQTALHFRWVRVLVYFYVAVY